MADRNSDCLFGHLGRFVLSLPFAGAVEMVLIRGAEAVAIRRPTGCPPEFTDSLLCRYSRSDTRSSSTEVFVILLALQKPIALSYDLG